MLSYYVIRSPEIIGSERTEAKTNIKRQKTLKSEIDGKKTTKYYCGKKG